jgi:hypothetical protein
MPVCDACEYERIKKVIVVFQNFLLNSIKFFFHSEARMNELEMVKWKHERVFEPNT